MQAAPTQPASDLVVPPLAPSSLHSRAPSAAHSVARCAATVRLNSAESCTPLASGELRFRNPCGVLFSFFHLLSFLFLPQCLRNTCVQQSCSTCSGTAGSGGASTKLCFFSSCTGTFLALLGSVHYRICLKRKSASSRDNRVRRTSEPNLAYAV